MDWRSQRSHFSGPWLYGKCAVVRLVSGRYAWRRLVDRISDGPGRRDLAETPHPCGPSGGSGCAHQAEPVGRSSCWCALAAERQPPEGRRVRRLDLFTGCCLCPVRRTDDRQLRGKHRAYQCESLQHCQHAGIGRAVLSLTGPCAVARSVSTLFPRDPGKAQALPDFSFSTGYSHWSR